MSVPTHIKSFETGSALNWWDFDGGSSLSRASRSTVTSTFYDGAKCGQFTIGAGSGNDYNRAYLNFTRGNGPENGVGCWWGGAVYFPAGFLAAQQGQIDLLRIDNYDQDANTTERVGQLIINRDGLMQMQSQVNHGTIVTHFTVSLGGTGGKIQEGVWYWVDIRTLPSHINGSALTEVWVDGVLKGTSTTRNTFRSDWWGSRLRAGLCAINGNTQTDAISLRMDRVYIQPLTAGRLGALSGDGGGIPDPDPPPPEPDPEDPEPEPVPLAPVVVPRLDVAPAEVPIALPAATGRALTGRDVLTDPASGVAFPFLVNHKEEQSLSSSRALSDAATTAAGWRPGKVIRQQGSKSPARLKLNGVAPPAQHQALLQFAALSRRQTLIFTHCAGESYEVLITAYEHTRQRVIRGIRGDAEQWTYSLEMEIVNTL